MEKEKMLKIIGLIVVLALGGAGAHWLINREPEREMPAVMEELSEKTAAQFAEKLPRIQDVNDLLVVPRVGGRDEDNQLREIVFDALEDVRKYKIIDWKRMKEEFQDLDSWERIFLKFLGPGGEPRDIEQASRAAKELRRANKSIDGVLFVDCIYDQGPRDDALGASVELQAQFFDCKQNKELPDLAYSAKTAIESSFDRLYLTHKLDNMSFIGRLFLWLALVTLQPWALISLVRMVLRKRENSYNAVLLVGFTIIGVAAAWPLLLTLGSIGLGSVLFLMLLSGLCGYYNYDAIEYIDRRFV